MRARKVTHKQTDPTGYRVNGRVWVEKDGELYLGWGRILLLQKIDELGSIAAAAQEMKLGYRNAWLWIDAMNRLAPSPLVEKKVGGERGGFAHLTDEGRKAIGEYKELRQRFQDFVNLRPVHSSSAGGS